MKWRPSRIRTYDLRLRSPLLYPTELSGRIHIITSFCYNSKSLRVLVQRLVCKFSKLEMGVRFSPPAPSLTISIHKGHRWIHIFIQKSQNTSQHDIEDASEFYDVIERSSLTHQLSENRPYVYWTMEIYDKSNGIKGGGGLGVLAADTRRVAEKLEFHS